MRLLFEGGIYFFGKPGDINDGWIGYERVRRWWLLDAVCSTHSLSVLLSAVGTTRTTQTVLALAWWPSSETIHTRVRMPHLLATTTIRGGRLLRLRALDCAATIPEWWLFEGGIYSKKYSTCMCATSCIYMHCKDLDHIYTQQWGQCSCRKLCTCSTEFLKCYS